MALRVYKYGEKVLREKSVPVVAVTPALVRLADDMVALMRQSKGVGLAAQQVGHRERLCVIDIPEDCQNNEEKIFNAPIPMPLKLFNPEILSREGTQCDKEGCLSFPGIGGTLTRAEQVTCQYLDDIGVPQVITAKGLLARAIQHEVDHLDGVLYIDRMTAIDRLTYAGKLKKLAKQNGGTR